MRRAIHNILSIDGVLVALMAVAIWGCTAGAEHRDATQGGVATIQFKDVTHAAGLGDFLHENGAVGRKWYPEMMGSGGGFFDFDGDGWLDILLLGGGTWDPEPGAEPRAIWLYRNMGDGTFVDYTEEAGLLDVRAYTVGFAAADYDNDGDTDFVVTNIGRDMLFRNDGGRFTEVGIEAGLGEREEWGSSPIFFDADRDGDLDLFVGQYVRWTPETDKWCPEGSRVKLYCIPADYEGIASRFYRNNGDGTFTDQTEGAGFITGPREIREKALGVVEIDYNEDGWPDLYVTTDGEGNLLYENNGDGTFTERGILSGVAYGEHGEARAGMGVDAGVIDSTGLLSLLVGNFSEEPVSVYRHAGGGLFVDRTAASKLAHPSYLTLTFGLVLFDVDLDGDLDLFIANGHVYPDRLEDQDKITFEQPAQLFLNAGDGTFSEVKQDDGVLSTLMVARGAAYADFDRDGDLDLLITENAGPVRLWRNDTSGGNFLRVGVSRPDANREALGTRIVAVMDGLRMERRVRTGSSYLSQSELVATFGLGNAESVDSLIVYWPYGRVDRFADVGANQEIRLVEGEGHWVQVPMSGSSDEEVAVR